MVLHPLGSLGPLHGYAISARLEQVSLGALQLNMGTLYPALMRLEQRGLIRGNWGASDTKRKARFYELTPAGRRLEIGHLRRRVASDFAGLLHRDALLYFWQLPDHAATAGECDIWKRPFRSAGACSPPAN